MKNKQKITPVIFLVLGILFVCIVSGVSISKYVKDKKHAVQQVAVIKSKEAEKEEKLFFNKPESKPENVNLKVYKKKKILELYSQDKLLGRFKIGLGRSPEGEKEKEGDNKTPEGKYYICYKNGNTKYTYFMGISYPNTKDAERGLKQGIIDEKAYNRIKKAEETNNQPPWDTPLGGAVGIHGGSNKYDWTYGCVALSDEDINILKQYIPMKTVIEIFK